MMPGHTCNEENEGSESGTTSPEPPKSAVRTVGLDLALTLVAIALLILAVVMLSGERVKVIESTAQITAELSPPPLKCYFSNWSIKPIGIGLLKQVPPQAVKSLPNVFLLEVQRDGSVDVFLHLKEIPNCLSQDDGAFQKAVGYSRLSGPQRLRSAWQNYSKIPGTTSNSFDVTFQLFAGAINAFKQRDPANFQKNATDIRDYLFDRDKQVFDRKGRVLQEPNFAAAAYIAYRLDMLADQLSIQGYSPIFPDAIPRLEPGLAPHRALMIIFGHNNLVGAQLKNVDRDKFNDLDLESKKRFTDDFGGGYLDEIEDVILAMNECYLAKPSPREINDNIFKRDQMDSLQYVLAKEVEEWFRKSQKLEVKLTVVGVGTAGQTRTNPTQSPLEEKGSFELSNFTSIPVKVATVTISSDEKITPTVEWNPALTP